MVKKLSSLLCVLLACVFISCSNQNKTSGSVSVKFSDDITSKLSLLSSARTVEDAKYEIKLTVDGDFVAEKTLAFDELSQINGAEISVVDIDVNSKETVTLDISYASKVYYSGSETLTIVEGENPVVIKLKPAFTLSDFDIVATYEADKETSYKSGSEIPLNNDNLTFTAKNDATEGYTWLLNDVDLQIGTAYVTINPAKNENVKKDAENKLVCKYTDGPFVKSSEYTFTVKEQVVEEPKEEEKEPEETNKEPEPEPIKGDVKISVVFGAGELDIKSSYNFDILTSGAFVYSEKGIITFTVEQNNKTITDGTNLIWCINGELIEETEEKASIVIPVSSFNLTKTSVVQCYALDGDKSASGTELINFVSDGSGMALWNHDDYNQKKNLNLDLTSISDSFNDFFFDSYNYDFYVVESGRPIKKYKNIITSYVEDSFNAGIELSYDSKITACNNILAYTRNSSVNIYDTSNQTIKVITFSDETNTYSSISAIFMDTENLYIVCKKSTEIENPEDPENPTYKTTENLILKKNIQSILESQVELQTPDLEIDISSNVFGLNEYVVTNVLGQNVVYKSSYSINDIQVLNKKIFVLFGLKGSEVETISGYNTIQNAWSRGGIICFDIDGNLQTSIGTNGIIGFNNSINPTVASTYKISDESKSLFYPSKFIAIKPDELVIADDGAYIYEEDKVEKKRICTYDLSSVLTITDTSYGFSNGISCFF